MTDPLHQLGRANVAAVEAVHLQQMLDKPFAALEAEYIRRWRLSRDINEREDAHVMLRALDELRGHILAVAKGGDVAAFNLRRTVAARAKQG
jgi:hypothetical protein